MTEAEVDYYLRIAEVERQSGLTRSSIYSKMREGTFPLPKMIGRGQVRWEQSRITAWKRDHPEAEYRPPPSLPVSAAG